MTRVEEFRSGVDDLVRNSADRAELLRNDEVGLESGEQRAVEMIEAGSRVNRCADVTVDFRGRRTAGRRSGRQCRQCERFGRIIAFVRNADDFFARADSKENLRRARQQADDSQLLRLRL